LKTAAILAAAAQTLPAQHTHSAEAVTQIAVPLKPKVFSADELATLSVLTDLIIPRTDTPGASDVGVPVLIDNAIARFPAAQKEWRNCLAWFNQQAGGNFRSLSNAQQIAILKPISGQTKTAGARWFTLLKDSTIDLYYSTKEGLADELGWHGNTYRTKFDGCTHPEHQS
jgi:hypothetical protein